MVSGPWNGLICGSWRDFPPFDTYRRGCDNEYGVANDVYAMEGCRNSFNSAMIYYGRLKGERCRRYQWFQPKAREELIGGTTRLFPSVMFRQSSVSPIEPQSTPIWRYQEFKINDGDPQWRLIMFERRSGQLFDESPWLWWFWTAILLFFGVGAMEVAVDDDIRRPKAAVAHHSHP